jgi:tRNA nucleotidyltransferase/poly(A) polymerase
MLCAGLEVEELTLAALQQHSHLIINLNSHRLTAELLSMLGYGAALPSLQLLEQTHLLQHLLPLHAAYIHRQQQQSGRPLQQTACTILSAQCSTSSSSSSSPACEEDGLQWRQLQHISSEPQAYSALGQLWSCVHGIKPSSGQQQQQQQQQQVQALHDQHRRLQHANLLLRVLAGLDQHASVSQPAQAEVVLTCLTAPLLVEALTAAAVQLHCHVQQQARQQEAARQHDQYQQQQLQAEQQQHGALHVLAAASGFKHAAADTYTLVMRSLPAARRIARPFSSSSSCSSSSTAAADNPVPSSCASGLESDSLVQQLLQGVAPEECMQQHIIRLAAKVRGVWLSLPKLLAV